jgi:hypothetical protein
LTLASKNRKSVQQAQYISEQDASSSSPSLSSSSCFSAVDVTTEHAPRYQSRLGLLKAKAGSSAGEGQRSDEQKDDFFDKLRVKSFKNYDEKIKENRILVENDAISEN